MTVNAEVEQFRKEQEVEWGTYVAAQPINIDGARAFNVGDAVPVSHVERGVVDAALVAKRTTKTGAAIVESVTPVDTTKG